MTTLRRRLLGVLFIALLAGFVVLSVAVFNKSFSSFVRVTLTSDKIGNQLQARSDVKVRGLIVGSVESIRPTGRGAELTLALDPEKVAVIPGNVSARFLPKTLFGERYVALQIPDRPAAEPLREGARIEQDTSAPAIELEKALNDLLPVLQAVQPQKLSSTLTAISTALEGRGKPLGETLAELGRYVGELTPHIPKLQHDLQALTKVSDTYNSAAPQLIQALSDLTVTSKTIADQRLTLSTLYDSLTTASTDLRNFLAANSDNLIRFADSSRPTLELLAKYAPEYPCFLTQMAEQIPKLDTVFGKGTNEPGLHVTLEIVVNRGPYKAGQDEPRFEDRRGPRCYDPAQFPVPFPQHPPDGPLKDGSTPPAAARTSLNGVQPAGQSTAPASAGVTGSLAGSQAEQRFVTAMMAGQLGVDPDEVPAWTALLAAPLFRGAEVTAR